MVAPLLFKGGYYSRGGGGAHNRVPDASACVWSGWLTPQTGPPEISKQRGGEC